MHRRLRAIAASALVCAAFAACAAPASTPPAASPLAARSGARVIEPHWTKVSIGRFADPYGVAVDASGTLYVADPGSKSVYRIPPGGSREVIGDFSIAVGSKFDPQGVSIAPSGYLAYVADRGSRSVWFVKADQTVGVVHGPPSQSSHYPRGVAYGAGASNGVYVGIVTTTPLSSKGAVRCVALSCPILGAREFENPYGVAADDRGNVYVADAGAKQVFRIDASGTKSIGRFADPYGVAVTPDGSDVYVADAGAKKVFAGKPDGSSWTEIGTFGDPYGVAADARGDVYVADPGTKDVWKLTR